MSTNLAGESGDLNFAASGPCAACGFVPQAVTPEAAVDTLKSFPGLWRKALAVHLDDPDPDTSLGGRTSALGWSPLEHAGHVRDVIHALDIRLQRVVREDEPTLPATHNTPPSGADQQGMAVVLAALTVTSGQLAATIASTPASAWSRRAYRSGSGLTAMDLVREAVHEGQHHLRHAVDTLAQLRSGSHAVRS